MRAPREDRRQVVGMVPQVADGIVAGYGAAQQQQDLGNDEDENKSNRERSDLGDDVITTGEGAGEVEGKRVRALVAADDLRRREGAEEGEYD